MHYFHLFLYYFWKADSAICRTVGHFLIPKKTRFWTGRYRSSSAVSTHSRHTISRTDFPESMPLWFYVCEINTTAHESHLKMGNYLNAKDYDVEVRGLCIFLTNTNILLCYIGINFALGTPKWQCYFVISVVQAYASAWIISLM